MALSEIDRKLLQRCLTRKPRAWEDFVDRFMGVVVHVVNHTAMSRSIRLAPADQEDLVAEVLLGIIDDDFAVLRHFRGESSLATYLTVIAQRITVRELQKHRPAAAMGGLGDAAAYVEELGPVEAGRDPFEDRLGDREQVERLLGELPGDEAQVVRLFHLEGRSYAEISAATRMPENSIGPTLSRARAKLRRAAEHSFSPR